MKFSLLIFGLAWLAFFSASAQVTVDVVLDQEQFLPSETLPVAVRITNRSGQPLHLGADSNWLTFSVESVSGPVVVKKTDVPVQGEFDLGSSQVATKRVDLAPFFELTRQGGYRLTATVRIKDWDVAIPSPPRAFEVIDGAKLWSQTFGLPVPAGVRAASEPSSARKNSELSETDQNSAERGTDRTTSRGSAAPTEKVPADARAA